MSKSFIIHRLGNKTNDIKYFKHLLPINVKNVVEPFGGTFAVIRNVYCDDKYKKYVNDNDNVLYYAYTNPDKIIDGMRVYNNIYDKNIYESGKPNSKKISELLKKNKMNDNIKQYIINNFCIRGCLYKKCSAVNENNIHLMNKINFLNEDAFDVIEKYRKDKNTFIFLDPPYLFSDNSSYMEQKINKDMTSYIEKIYNILKDKTTKAKIMLVINDLSIIRWIFKDYIIMEYEKTYQLSKKKNNHVVICNYKCD